MNNPSDPDDQRPGGDEDPSSGPTGEPAWSMPPMPPPMSPVDQGYAQPGVVPLHPLGVGNILSGAFATMRTRPGLMLGMSVIVVTVIELIVLAFTFPLQDDLDRLARADPAVSSDEVWDLVGSYLMATLGATLFSLVAGVFLTGFLTQVVGDAVLGRRSTFGGVWARVRSRILPLLGVTAVIFLAALGMGLVVVLLWLLSPALGVLGGLAALVVGIWLAILFSLATPAVVLENLGVMPAFGRSRYLVTGTWWRIFGILLLAGLITVAAAFFITLPFEIAAGGYDLEQVTRTGSDLTISAIGAIVASTITQPFLAAVVVLLYVDQRFRREGMHFEMMRAGT